MEYRTSNLATGLILLSWLMPAFASEPAPEKKADWEQRLTVAQTQQREAKAMRVAAKTRYESEKRECFKKFRVTDCQEDARSIYIASTNEARRLENQGLATERLVRKEERADSDARYAAEAPEREANLREREAETMAERARSESRRAAKLAEKKKHAAEAVRRNAKESERREKKRADHEKQVAEKMEKARRRDAEADE